MRKNKTNKDKMLEKYTEFLKTGGWLTDGSIESYLSYLRKACQKFIDEEFNRDVLEWVASIKKIEDRRILVNLFVQVLDNELCQKGNCGIERKTLQNYRSGLNMFKRFIYDKAFKIGGEDLALDIRIPYEYYKETIRDNFIFRLNTQDRIYKKEQICFPTRLFEQIFRHDKAYFDALNELIKKTEFLVSKDSKDKVKLNEIRFVKIIDGKVTIITQKAEELTLYTEIYEKGKPKGYAPLIAKNKLADLSLDHETPISTILKSGIKEYPILEDLSKNYLSFKTSTKYTQSKLATEYYSTLIQSPSFTTEWKNELFKEIVDIYAKMQLVIMQTNYNSSKNDSK